MFNGARNIPSHPCSPSLSLCALLHSLGSVCFVCAGITLNLAISDREMGHPCGMCCYKGGFCDPKISNGDVNGDLVWLGSSAGTRCDGMSRWWGLLWLESARAMSSGLCSGGKGRTCRGQKVAQAIKNSHKNKVMERAVLAVQDLPNVNIQI